MPPWPGIWTHIDSSSWPLEVPSLEPRRLVKYKMPPLTAQQTHELHVAAITAASLSITASILASIWFFRMRRSFRHDLIMLLIFSDMFKAFWFLLFPVVELLSGTIISTSTFCQVSGFFLSLSIEMSDLSVAMICIHTALYIFRGEQGLYPFRKFAYAVYAIVPILMASLAFAESPGYINTGQFCYLPFDPMWKRLALSWIPRYLAFATIFFLCLAIYVYVRVLMQRFRSKRDNSKKSSSRLSAVDTITTDTNSYPLRTQSASVPATPLFKTHRLFQSPLSSPGEPAADGLDPSRPTLPPMLNSDHIDIAVPALAHPSSSRLHSVRSARRASLQAWPPTKPTNEAAAPSEADGRVSLGTTHCDSDGSGPPFEVRPHEFVGLSNVPRLDDAQPNLPRNLDGYDSRSLDLSMGASSRIPSLPNIFTMLHNEPDQTQGYQSDLILTQSDIDSSGVVKAREKIIRQLHLLFVYPLVYVVIWILPFIVHLTGYGKGAPYAMRMTSLVFLCLHGFADALVFSLKEQPWKHSKPFNIHGLKFWKRRPTMNAGGPRVGRTREEMMVDGRLARVRRDQELVDQRLQREAEQGSQPVRKPPTDWWDNDE